MRMTDGTLITLLLNIRGKHFGRYLLAAALWVGACGVAGGLRIVDFGFEGEQFAFAWQNDSGARHVLLESENLVEWTARSAHDGASPPMLTATLPISQGGSAFFRLSSDLPEPQVWYVSPTGDDSADGLSPESAFASLEKARDAYRAWADGTVDRDAEIRLNAGTYFRDHPLELTFDDRGRNGFRLTIRGPASGQAELVGGRLLDEWEAVGGGIYRTAIDDPNWRPEQLFDNNVRQIKARYPNTGYLESSGGSGLSLLRYGALPTVANPGEVEVGLWASHDWFFNILDVSAWDATNGRFSTVQNAIQPITAGNRFFLQGAYEFLDAPGEFYHDVAGGWLYYWPPSGSPAGREIIAPVTDVLLSLIGDEIDFLEGLRIEKLRFRMTAFPSYFREIDSGSWNRPSSLNRKGAIYLSRARGVEIIDCSIENAGLNAIALDLDTESCRIENNELVGAGYHAILLTGTNVDAEVRFDNRGHLIHNNTMAHCGALVGHSGGVFLYQSGDNVISNNDIHDMPRYGVGLKSMRKGVMPAALRDNHFQYLTTRGNRIENNDMWNLITDSDDAGAVTLWGTGQFNEIRNNRIRAIDGQGLNGQVMGIYLDDGADYTTVQKNLVYELDGAIAAPVVIKGIHNVIEHNIFTRRDGVSGFRHLQFVGEPVFAHTLRHNILYIDSSAPGSQVVWSVNEYTEDLIAASANNVFWVVGANPLFINALPDANNFANWVSLFGDDNSVVADPLFADPANGDFSLLPGSPALVRGFQGIELSIVGRQL